MRQPNGSRGYQSYRLLSARSAATRFRESAAAQLPFSSCGKMIVAFLLPLFLLFLFFFSWTKQPFLDDVTGPLCSYQDLETAFRERSHSLYEAQNIPSKYYRNDTSCSWRGSSQDGSVSALRRSSAKTGPKDSCQLYRATNHASSADL